MKNINNWRNLLLHIPPPPPTSNILFCSPVHIDSLISTQLHLLYHDIRNLRQLIEKKNHSNETKFLLKILLMTPPPLLPQLPPPTNKVKRLFHKAVLPGIGRGNSYIRRRKRQVVRKDFYSKLRRNDELFSSHTGMSHQDFLELLERTKDKIMAPRDIHFFSQSVSSNRRTPYTNRLSPANRLLACLMILRQSCKFSAIQMSFGYSKAAISNEFRHVLMAIFVTEGESIKIPQEWNPPHPLLGTIGSVDHSHFKIGRTRYDQSRFYRRDKGHAIIGQVTVDRCGNIIHMSVGYRGASNDQLILSLSNVVSMLPRGKRLCADGGFRTKDLGLHLVTPDNLKEDEILSHFQKVERVIVECTIGFVKRYEILSSRFRHNIALLPLVAMVCACLTNKFLQKHPIRTPESVANFDEHLEHKFSHRLENEKTKTRDVQGEEQDSQ